MEEYGFGQTVNNGCHCQHSAAEPLPQLPKSDRVYSATEHCKNSTFLAYNSMADDLKASNKPILPPATGQSNAAVSKRNSGLSIPRWDASSSMLGDQKDKSSLPSFHVGGLADSVHFQGSTDMTRHQEHCTGDRAALNRATALQRGSICSWKGHGYPLLSMSWRLMHLNY